MRVCKCVFHLSSSGAWSCSVVERVAVPAVKFSSSLLPNFYEYPKVVGVYDVVYRALYFLVKKSDWGCLNN